MFFIGESKGFLGVSVEIAFPDAVVRSRTADLVLDGVECFHVEQAILFHRNPFGLLAEGDSILRWQSLIFQLFLDFHSAINETTRC